MARMLITGASRGIGAATAVVAARAGFDVWCTWNSDASADSASALVATLAREFPDSDVRLTRANVASEADVLALFAAIDREWGGLDCLVNNAGVAPGYGPFDELTVADLEHTWAVNLTGAFLCAREAVRRMATDFGGTGGSIVNVGSKAAAIGGPNEWIHYAASKGAIDTLTAGLAKEYGARGIRTNCIRPGLINGGFGPWAPEGRVESMTPAIPMQRGADPSEVAEAILWLATPAASYVNGAILDVTGGR